MFEGGEESKRYIRMMVEWATRRNCRSGESMFVDDGDDEFSFAVVSVWCADLGMDFGLFAPERRSRAPITAAALSRPYLADASLTLELSTQYLLAQTAVLPQTYSTQGNDMSSSAAHTSTSFL